MTTEVHPEHLGMGIEKGVHEFHTIYTRGDGFVGLVSRCAEHPDVVDPEDWTAVILTTDEYYWDFGGFRSKRRGEATRVVEEGIERNWTLEQWQEAKSKSKSE
jgi:hypothetical protein